MMDNSEESMNEDIKTVEKLLLTLQDTIPLINTLHTASSIKQLQATMDSHIDHLFIVTKSIIQRLSAIDHHHPHPGNGNGNGNGELVIIKIKALMDGFQGLRLNIVALYKQTIESIYYRVTNEKQCVETIENLISTGEIDAFLRVAALDHQEASLGILDVVQQIHQRINNAKYMQNYLIQLHHLFLDILALLKGKRGGEGQLRDASIIFDHRMDPKKKATTAATIILLVMFFILLVILIVILIVSLIQLENERERERERSRL